MVAVAGEARRYVVRRARDGLDAVDVTGQLGVLQHLALLAVGTEGMGSGMDSFA